MLQEPIQSVAREADEGETLALINALLLLHPSSKSMRSTVKIKDPPSQSYVVMSIVIYVKQHNSVCK